MWEYLVIFFRLPILFLYILLITVCFIPFLIIISISFINLWLLALLFLFIAQFILIVINEKDASLSYFKFLCGVHYIRFINYLLENIFKDFVVIKNWTLYYSDDTNLDDLEDTYNIFIKSFIFIFWAIAIFLLSSFIILVILGIIYTISSKFNIEIINYIFKNIISFINNISNLIYQFLIG